MRIAINRRAFLDRFEVAASFAPKRSSMAVLTNVHMHAEDGTLQMNATDTETGISVSVPCEVLVPGDALAPRDRLLAILTESDCEIVELHATDSLVNVTCGTAEFKLQSGNPLEFPLAHIDQADDAQTSTISFDDLHQAISRTAFATDPDSVRFALGGVLFSFNGTYLDLVGTDGRRLSTVNIPCVGTLVRDFIVPAKSLQLLSRTKASGDITFYPWNNSIVICSQDMRFFSREVEGRFPNWKHVIPDTSRYTALSVNSRDVTCLFRQASITQDMETRGIDILFESGRISASCSTQDIGRSQSECSCDSPDDSLLSDDLKINMKIDSRYILDFLKTVPPEDNLTIHVQSESLPMLLSAGGHRYVIMPMAK